MCQCRRRFTLEEDSIIRKLHDEEADWKTIASFLENRTPKQVRERYLHKLEPTIKNKSWTPEEDDMLRECVKITGCHWKLLSLFFQGRSATNIKNRWHHVLSNEQWVKNYPLLQKRKNKKKNLVICEKSQKGNGSPESECTRENVCQENSEKNIELDIDLFDKDELLKFDCLSDIREFISEMNF